MRTVNALELRQSLGRVLRQLEGDGAPIVVHRGRNPAAVLISLRDFRERFADKDADERRGEILAAIKATRFKRPTGKTTLGLLRDMRSGRA